MTYQELSSSCCHEEMAMNPKAGEETLQPVVSELEQLLAWSRLHLCGPSSRFHSQPKAADEGHPLSRRLSSFVFLDTPDLFQLVRHQTPVVVQLVAFQDS
jgi:hypothetical protein